MSQARDLLKGGWAVLRQEYATPFTVDGYNRVFIGLCEEARYGTDLVAGGFKMEADATLGVEVSEFAAVGLVPAAGMKVRVYGVDCLIARVGKNDLRWSLTLEAAQTES
jgi:hypothetical protein